MVDTHIKDSAAFAHAKRIVFDKPLIQANPLLNKIEAAIIPKQFTRFAMVKPNASKCTSACHYHLPQAQIVEIYSLSNGSRIIIKKQQLLALIIKSHDLKRVGWIDEGWFSQDDI